MARRVLENRVNLRPNFAYKNELRMCQPKALPRLKQVEDSFGKFESSDVTRSEELGISLSLRVRRAEHLMVHARLHHSCLRAASTIDETLSRSFRRHDYPVAHFEFAFAPINQQLGQNGIAVVGPNAKPVAFGKDLPLPVPRVQHGILDERDRLPALA